MPQLLDAIPLSDELTVKNRFVMPPMVNYKATQNGETTYFHEVHYGARALGGVGLIIVEATAVEKRGRLSLYDLGLWDDHQVEGHKRIVKACHEFDSKIAVQLAHSGRKCPRDVDQCVGPSAISFSKDYDTPIDLTLKDIHFVKRNFISSAIRAEKAGYDCIEIHAAHGYLINSFLSPLSNKRVDKYGGSFENRIRLLIEIIEEIEKNVQIPIGVRISATEWRSDGWGLSDSIRLCEILEGKIVYIHISDGGNSSEPDNPPEIKPLYQVHYAETIKRAVNIPVIAVGLITTIEQGNQVLQNGKCDLVAYGRELTRNPNLPQFAAKKMYRKNNIEPSYIRSFQ